MALMNVLAHLLAANGPIPNHPRWPLLIYPGAVTIAGPDPAAAFEELFARNRWPAVDVSHSLSRVMDLVVAPAHRAAAARLRQLLAAYESKRELIALGAYQQGSDRATDEALARIDRIEAYLRQARDERSGFDETVRALEDAVR